MNMTERMVLLRSLPFFGALPEARLTNLARDASVTAYAPGSLIASEGQSAEAFHLVASGRVKLYKSVPDGREQTLYVLGAGEPFCMCFLVESDNFPVFASALTEARVLSFPLPGLIEAARRDPEILFDLLRLMCSRLKEAMVMVESLALHDLPGRLACFLLHEAERSGSGDTARLTLSQRELSKIVGATPEAVSRALRRLGEAGLVSVQGREVKLLDRPGLLSAAGKDPDKP